MGHNLTVGIEFRICLCFCLPVPPFGPKFFWGGTLNNEHGHNLTVGIELRICLFIFLPVSPSLLALDQSLGVNMGLRSSVFCFCHISNMIVEDNMIGFNSKLVLRWTGKDRKEANP